VHDAISQRAAKRQHESFASRAGRCRVSQPNSPRHPPRLLRGSPRHEMALVLDCAFYHCGRIDRLPLARRPVPSGVRPRSDVLRRCGILCHARHSDHHARGDVASGHGNPNRSRPRNLRAGDWALICSQEPVVFLIHVHREKAARPSGRSRWTFGFAVTFPTARSVDTSESADSRRRVPFPGRYPCARLRLRWK